MITVIKPKKLRKPYLATMRLERDHVASLLEFFPPEMRNVSYIVRHLIEEELKRRVLINPQGPKVPLSPEEKKKREQEFRQEIIPRLQSRHFSRSQINDYLIEHRLAPLAENELK